VTNTINTTMNTTLYARIEDLRKLIAQAEAEHHQGSLGIVRIALKDVGETGEGLFDIDMASDLHSRVLIG
jgi:hypothetical protein